MVVAVLKDRFIHRVNEILDAEGISRAELARLMGVAQPVVLQYLNGKSSPGLEMIERFAKALGCHDAGELLAEEVASHH